MENIKNSINKLVLTIIISTVLFSLIDIDSKIYFSIVILIWIFVIINLSMLKNLEFYELHNALFIRKILYCLFSNYIIY